MDQTGNRDLLEQLEMEAVQAYHYARELLAGDDEQMDRMGRLVRAAREMYSGDITDTLTFVMRPHAMLAGRPPLAVARDSEDGLRKVTELIGRAQYT